MNASDPLSVMEDTQSEAGRKGPPRHPFFISAPRNLEALLEEELREMGIANPKARHLGVDALLSREEVYRVVYNSRLASRVLRPLATFPCRDADELYAAASKLNWSHILKEGQTLKVSAT